MLSFVGTVYIMDSLDAEEQTLRFRMSKPEKFLCQFVYSPSRLKFNSDLIIAPDF